jgi:transcriptional regulator with XRE-family HTH domain
VAVRRHEFVERRRALGYSQESLAAKLGVDRTTIARLERGVTTPYPYTRLKLCRILEVTAAELDGMLGTGSSKQLADSTNSRATDHSESTGVLDDMQRRELLRVLSVAGALLALPAGVDSGPDQMLRTAPAEPDNVQEYEDLNAHLWQVFGLTRPKRLLYPLVHHQLAVLVDRLHRARSAVEHRQLCVLSCELFQLAGEIFFDADRYTDAAYCYSLAASAGREVRSYDRWACALTRQAFVNLYDRQYVQAASVLDVAARIARHGDSQLSTRQWVAAVQAQAFAGLGDRDACERALETAEQVYHLTGPVNPGGWLRFDGGRLAEERGTCYLALGQIGLAERTLLAANDDTMSLRRRGGLLTDLASLAARRQDLDRVIEYAGEAVGIAEQTRSTGYLGRKMQDFQSKLTPDLLGEAPVARLAERITGLRTAVA